MVRKIMSLMVALLLCVGLVCPALAAENVFVPSISYKDGPDIEKAFLSDKNVTGCLAVTTITGAREKATDIDQEDRDLLLDVYKKLDDGDRKMPLDEDYVIRELVDVSWQKTTCVEAEHGHKSEISDKSERPGDDAVVRRSEHAGNVGDGDEGKQEAGRRQDDVHQDVELH